MDKHLKTTHIDSNALAQAWDLIKKSERITLLTHFKPDGDGVSACAALSHILIGMGKEIETIYPTECEQIIERQGANVRINTHQQAPNLLIACDTSNLERLYYPESFKELPLINIDHHVSNSIDGTFNFIDVVASSTCELLYALCNAWKVSIDEYVASALLFGILYDTQVFQTQNTTRTTLEVAAELIKHGAPLYALKTELLTHKNPQIIKLWGQFLSNTQIDEKKGIAWTVITQKELQRHGLAAASLVGFNNFLAQIAGIDITALFYEMASGKTKVSLRSKVADVNKIAATFGGGGHVHASGIVSDLPIDQLVEQVIRQC